MNHRNRLDLLYLRYKLDANPTRPTTPSTRSSKNRIFATTRQGKLRSGRGLRRRVGQPQSHSRSNRHHPKCLQDRVSLDSLFSAAASSCISSSRTEQAWNVKLALIILVTIHYTFVTLAALRRAPSSPSTPPRAKTHLQCGSTGYSTIEAGMVLLEAKFKA